MAAPRKKVIVKVVEEPVVVEEKLVLNGKEVETLPDRSNLNEADRIQSLKNLMQQLPKQYWDNPKDGKRNLWSILRFEPTDEQLTIAKEAIEADELKSNKK